MPARLYVEIRCVQISDRVSRTGRQPVRLNPPSHRRCILPASSQTGVQSTIQYRMRDVATSRTRDGLTSLPPHSLPFNSHHQLAYLQFLILHDKDSLLPAPRSPPPSFPPRDNLNLNLHALSLIDILYFPFKRSVPSSSLESHHITPAVKPSRLGLGVFPTPSLSFLPFCRPLSPSRSSMLPRSPLLPARSRRTAHSQPTRMASYLPALPVYLFAFALPRCFCFCLPHGISSFWTEERETRVET